MINIKSNPPYFAPIGANGHCANAFILDSWLDRPLLIFSDTSMRSRKEALSVSRELLRVHNLNSPQLTPAKTAALLFVYYNEPVSLRQLSEFLMRDTKRTLEVVNQIRITSETHPEPWVYRDGSRKKYVFSCTYSGRDFCENTMRVGRAKASNNNEN